MEYDNPARRLHILLNKAFEIASLKEKDTATKKVPLKSRSVWIDVFGIQNNDEELLEYTEEFILLVKRTREEIKKMPSIRHATYMKGVNFISKSISLYGLTGKNWNEQGRLLKNESFIDYIEMVADAIDNRSKLPNLSKEQLDELRKDIDSILEDVLGSSLSEDIKLFLITRLQEIKSAIIHYSVSGSSGLVRVVEANIGATFLKSFNLSPESKSYFKKFFELMGKISMVLGFGADFKGFLLPTVTKVIDLIEPRE